MLSLASFAPVLSLAQTASYVEAGQVGVVDSWRSKEFTSNWGLQATGADYAYARGLSGAGIGVGIYDGGVANWHPDLAGTRNLTLGEPGCKSGQLLAGPDACFFTDSGATHRYTDAPTAAQQQVIDDAIKAGTLTQQDADALKSGFVFDDHGTHVAGIIGARRNGNGMHGVAYGASLFGAGKMSDDYQDALNALRLPNGVAMELQAPMSVEREMRRQMSEAGVRVINNSWGMIDDPATAADMDTLTSKASLKAEMEGRAALTRQYGTLQVHSAGNQSGRIAGLWASLPRYYAELEPYWLSVANVKNDGTLSASSSVCGLSKDWCISAPGTDIQSTIPTGAITGEVLRSANGEVIGLKVSDEKHLPDYGLLTGTSMAAPHVSGGLALLMERYPYLTNVQVRDVLLTTARDLGATGVDDIFGWGMMDLKKAIDGPAMLRVDSDVSMNLRAGGTKVWQGDAWDDWRNDISGPGKLTKSGAGWLRLSGNNSFAGAVIKQGVLELSGSNTLGADVQVAGGTLLLNGKLVDTRLDVRSGVAEVMGQVTGGQTQVAAAGRLQGNGTLSDTSVAGTIAPGGANAIGTLTIQGDYTQKSGSVYEVDTRASSSADNVKISGKATLEGGTVQVATATAELGRAYTIMQAKDISGQFASTRFDQEAPFLKAELDQSKSELKLSIARGQALASAARTINQSAVASAADRMNDSAELLHRLTRMSAAQAAFAFDQLSGETYASQESVRAEQGQHLNQAAAARIRTVQSQFFKQGPGNSSNGVWVDLTSRGGHLLADGNAAQTRFHASGLTLGYDHTVGENGLLGLLASSQKGDMTVRERGSRQQGDTQYFGVYGGQAWGPFALRAGLLTSRAKIRSERTVSYGSYVDRNQANYRGESRQGFLEGGYTFLLAPRFELEPFAQWSRVKVTTDAVSERGGLSSLQVQAGASKVDFATVGVRLEANLAATGQPSWLSLGGALAYRHASGDINPRVRSAWSLGSPLDSWGAPIAARATLLNLKVGARLGHQTLLELSYDGQFASRARDHAVNARLSWKF